MIGLVGILMRQVEAAVASDPKNETSTQQEAPATGLEEPLGLTQVIAGGMKQWFLMVALGLGIVGSAAAFLGLFVVASTLVSIVLISLTLYLFLRLWPEEERPRNSTARISEEKVEPKTAMVPAVRLNGHPRSRFLIALKEVARRQETFRISPQGAERFAKTIRYLLRASRQ